MSAVSSTHVPVLGAPEGLEGDGPFGSLTAPTYTILVAQEPYERLGLLVASLFPFILTICQVFFIGQRASLVATGNSEVHQPDSLTQDTPLRQGTSQRCQPALVYGSSLLMSATSQGQWLMNHPLNEPLKLIDIKRAPKHTEM